MIVFRYDGKLGGWPMNKLATAVLRKRETAI